MPQMLVAFDFQLAVPLHIVIAGRPDASDTQAMLRELHARFVPHKVIILADGGAGQKAIAHYIESIATVKMIDGKATAYVCKGAVCLPPTTNAATLASLLTGPRAEEAVPGME